MVFGDIIQRAGTRAGVTGDYGSHSPRAGFTTDALDAGASREQVQTYGGWQNAKASTPTAVAPTSGAPPTPPAASPASTTDLTAMAQFETQRLVLRPLTLDDLDDLAALHAEDSFWHYPLRRGQTRHETRAFIERQIDCYDTDSVGLMAAVERRSGKLTGWIGLSIPHFLPEVLPAVEVGWRLGRNWWGQGFATEGAAASIRHGFEHLGLDEIISIYEPDNTASGRVMDRLGLSPKLVTTHPPSGVELHVRSLTRTRWQQLLQHEMWPQ